MTVRKSPVVDHFKRIARPVLLPLLQRIGLRRSHPHVPVISARDRLHKNEVAASVTMRADQTILINGEPFFPIGLYYTQAEVDDATGTGLRKLREMGFNTIHFKAELDAYDQLDRIWGAGFRTWCRPPGALHGDFNLLKEVVSKFGRHPALFSWELDDEPLLNAVDFKDSATGCRLVRDIDPFHPILCNQWLSDLGQQEEILRWATLSDLHGFTIYPVPGWRWGKRISLVRQGWPHSIAVVGTQTDLWKSLTPKQPIIPVLQAWAWNCLEDGEAGYPTYQQSRFMAYQAVIHGARGLHYYGTTDSTRLNFACGLPPPKPYHDLQQTQDDFVAARKYNEWFWSYFADVIKEISRMSEVFVSEDATWSPEIRTQSESVEYRVKRYLDSAVVLAVNASDSCAAIEVQALQFKQSSLRVWGENRTIQLSSEGAFQDVLEPFAVRIYSDQPDLLAEIFNVDHHGS